MFTKGTYRGDDMKKILKLISLFLVVVLTVGVVTACPLADLGYSNTSNPGGTSNPGNGNSSSAGSDKINDTPIVNIPEDSVPLIHAPAVPIVLVPEAPGSNVEKNDKAIIDYSNTADGYIMIKWLTETDKQLRVLITGPTATEYTYTIKANNSFNVFPLSDGNGTYVINVVEQTEGDRYALALNHVINVTLNDEFAPFLRPNRFVNFSEESDVVIKAAELVTGKGTFPDKIAAVYDFVINNITYDVDFANEVVAGQHRGYVPDLDTVLKRRKGICFDYASLMTAMLRSQGIPTKLEIGYAGEIRHAWISVFSEETGWIDQAVFFDGESWILMDPTFASTANNSSALQQFIGDGSNYTVLYLH